ncbi:MAG: helicase-related protein, partial [Myxococcota bacterium]|nr:helicase-related protein [Myxococcota bacterium]
LLDRMRPTGVQVGRWTGEHHDGGRLHGVTVLTPESLDSRLSRAPEALTGVQAIVLDELHVLDGTARGDQLRVLVHRLRMERGMRAERDPRSEERSVAPLQVVAASATVPDLERMAGRYLRDPTLVAVGPRRKVRAHVVDGREPEGVAQALTEHVSKGFRKVLAFCNSREEVEVLSRYLMGRPPFGRAVLAHHGSLARRVRLQAEKRYLTAPTAICVCTSTMELGVDIGDVDLVALVGVPPSVASLLQRVGRGGRRTELNHVVAFVGGAFEARCLRTLLEAQKDGHWYTGPSVFRPGVLVQQAVSVLHGRRSRTVDAAALFRRLPPDLQSTWDQDLLKDVLAKAGDAGFLARVGTGPSGPVYGLGERGDREWSRGRLHSNLSDSQGVDVVDSITGDVVGRVARPEEGVSLGGRGRAPLKMDSERVVTRGATGAGVAAFASGGTFVIPAALATAYLESAGIPTPCRVLLRTGWCLFHGLGSGGGALLGAVFRLNKSLLGRGVRVARVGRHGLVLEGGPFLEGSWPSPTLVRVALGKSHRSVGRKLALGAHHVHLPDEIRLETVGRICEMDRVVAMLESGLPPIVDVVDEDLWNAAAWA